MRTSVPNKRGIHLNCYPFVILGTILRRGSVTIGSTARSMEGWLVIVMAAIMTARIVRGIVLMCGISNTTCTPVSVATARSLCSTRGTELASYYEIHTRRLSYAAGLKRGWP